MNKFIIERQDTSFLRALAILLVLNSHFDSFYPDARFATGGAIGDALFFALSGIGIFLSYKSKQLEFGVWFSKRVLRIYYSCWAVLVFIYFPLFFWNNFDPKQVLGYFSLFFFPPWWFLQAILVFYCGTFPLLKTLSKKYTFIFLGTLTMVYFIVYILMYSNTFFIELIPFKLFFYLFIYVFGFVLAINNEKIIYKGWRDLGFLLLSIFIFFGIKIYSQRTLDFTLQFIQHITLPFICYFALKCVRSSAIERLMDIKLVKRIVDFLSGHTLEIYIINSSISYDFFQQFLFPFNFIANLFVTFTLAFLCNKLISKLQLT